MKEDDVRTKKEMNAYLKAIVLIRLGIKDKEVMTYKTVDCDDLDKVIVPPFQSVIVRSITSGYDTNIFIFVSYPLQDKHDNQL